MGFIQKKRFKVCSKLLVKTLMTRGQSYIEDLIFLDSIYHMTLKLLLKIAFLA